nr:DUF1294 domain-containing protein [Klebsiella pneumoniae subsp. pneumoniae]
MNVPMNLNLVCYSAAAHRRGQRPAALPAGDVVFTEQPSTWLIYGADKLAARKAWRRVPETTLLVLAWREAGRGHPRPAVLSP